MQWRHLWKTALACGAFSLLCADPVAASGGHDIGHLLSFWYIVPFAGMLLSIAIVPMINAHWWERNRWLAVVLWSLAFLIPFTIDFGLEIAFDKFLEQIVLDYLPFIVLLLGLFAVSGGIILRGSLVGTPKLNALLLLIGTVLASWIGTTGASMLLLRPVIRANQWRVKKTHVIIFFIFLVSNIGGCLTPVGDPPLFLGFLRGVPFFWTMRLFPMLLMNTVILLTVLYQLDRFYYKRELASGNLPPREGDGHTVKEPLKVDGLHNLIFLAMIVGAVILSGVMAGMPQFADQATGELYGFHLYGTVTLPYNYAVQMAIILLAAFLSWRTTKKSIRSDNHFTWEPIKEVATLFIGIFITMIPVLALLGTYGGQLGIRSPEAFFWITGGLSSFLDNAPTYLVFLTAAGALGATEGVATTVGLVAAKMLIAVSAGAVFMGAITYIGNAPNFMVRSIAEENKIKMPSFFGYMAWSIGILVPLFLLDMVIFI